MIKLVGRDLQDGDILGVTAFDPVGGIIRAFTWHNLGKGDESTHTAGVARNVTTHALPGGINPGDLYISEMSPKFGEKNALQQTKLDRYDSAPWPWDCRVVWIGRHPAFTDPHLRHAYSQFVQTERDHGVEYGWEDLVKYIIRMFPENPRTMDCSCFQALAYKTIGIDIPGNWNFAPAPSPMDWQRWSKMRAVA
jgi:hypothetical protein